ncbi:DUF3854 domain-containing protein [Bacillus cihuensis]|uniref:DUF3854 domain-containing protein n=1 Tax=Bacillus cihuensis TaxID=1208599 RepID=UPI00068797A8|nr:DUF3854 domain-containing protein [Bacillus cihuensis]
MINEAGDRVVCIRRNSDIQFSVKFPSWIHYLTEQSKRNVSVPSDGNFIQGNKKANPNQLDRVYSTLLDCIDISSAHYEHLTSSTRKMSQKEIDIRGYKSFPEKPWNAVKEISNYLDPSLLAGIPGFFENKYGWSISGRQGILIPYRNHLNQIVGFQTRIDNPLNDVEINPGSISGLQARVKTQPNLVEILIRGVAVEEVELELGESYGVYSESGAGFVKLVKGQRYFWLSSANKENGTGAGDPLPVHVAVPSTELDNWEKGCLLNSRSVWLTEGALKADIAVEHITRVYNSEELKDVGSTFIATAGVNSWRSVIPVLKAMKVEHVNIAFDMDAMENPQVAFYLRELATYLRKEGYSANIAMWNPSDGKGIDDCVVNLRAPILKKLF